MVKKASNNAAQDTHATSPLKAKRIIRRYTDEFKQSAIRLVKSGQKAAQVARDMDIGEQTLCTWLQKDAAGTLADSKRPAISAEQSEISRLTKALARAEMERDILRKATAYFAKESL